MTIKIQNIKINRFKISIKTEITLALTNTRTENALRRIYEHQTHSLSAVCLWALQGSGCWKVGGGRGCFRKHDHTYANEAGSPASRPCQTADRARPLRAQPAHVCTHTHTHTHTDDVSPQSACTDYIRLCDLWHQPVCVKCVQFGWTHNRHQQHQYTYTSWTKCPASANILRDLYYFSFFNCILLNL